MLINLPKLYKWLETVFVNLKKHYKESIHVVKAKRQVGKSILAECISLFYALSNQKFRVYIIEPSFNQSDKIFNELLPMCKGLSFYQKSNFVKRQILFKNGSEIRLFSEQQGIAALQGYTCEMLIIDEAAFLKDDTIDAIFPYVNATHGPIIMFSTPQAKAGQFYNYFCMGLSSENNNVYSYDWCQYDTSELLSPAKLELYRKTVDPLKFKTYYLGQFLDNESKFFGNYDKCIIYNKPAFMPGLDYWFGIDWGSGTGGDWTAITVLCKGWGKTQLVDAVYFNDKDPNQTIDEIVKLAKKYHPKHITVELNSIGTVYFGLLRSALKNSGIPLSGFQTTNDSKDKIISNLQKAFQDTNIFLIRDAELINELLEYTLEFSKTGKRVFNGAPGTHDDLVMSLAIALNSITSGVYSVV